MMRSNSISTLGEFKKKASPYVFLPQNTYGDALIK